MDPESAAEAIAGETNGSHQDCSNYSLRLIVASIKPQRIGIRLRRGFAEPMASGMAIVGEVSGEYVE